MKEYDKLLLSLMSLPGVNFCLEDSEDWGNVVGTINIKAQIPGVCRKKSWFCFHPGACVSAVSTSVHPPCVHVQAACMGMKHAGQALA